MTLNTAKYAGGEYVKARYADIYTPKKVETRTPEEIKESILKKLREEA